MDHDENKCDICQEIIQCLESYCDFSRSIIGAITIDQYKIHIASRINEAISLYRKHTEKMNTGNSLLFEYRIYFAINK
jgi:hypothetical protein